MTRQNIISLLCVYNVTFLFLCVLVTNDWKMAFLVGFSAALVILTLITIKEILNDVQRVQVRLHNLDARIGCSIRSEYQKIHYLHRAQELLLKTYNLCSGRGRKSSDFNPLEHSTQHRQQVRLAFLNRHGPNRHHESDDEVHHPGL